MKLRLSAPEVRMDIVERLEKRVDELYGPTCRVQPDGKRYGFHSDAELMLKSRAEIKRLRAELSKRDKWVPNEPRELISRLNAAGHDERLATGQLYLDAAKELALWAGLRGKDVWFQNALFELLQQHGISPSSKELLDASREYEHVAGGESHEHD